MAFFDLGDGTRLYVSSAIEGDDDGVSPRENSVLYFRVDDIQAATEAVRSRGVTIEGEPHIVFTDAAGTFGAPGTEEWLAFFRGPGRQPHRLRRATGCGVTGSRVAAPTPPAARPPPPRARGLTPRFTVEGELAVVDVHADAVARLELAGEDALRQRVLDLAFHQAPQWTSAEVGVVALGRRASRARRR